LGVAKATGVIAATGLITAGTLVQGAAIVATGGAVLVALPIAYGAKAVFFRRDRRSASEKERGISDADFNDPMKWDCYWTTVVVVGCHRTGKTQLKKRLRNIPGLRGSARSTEGKKIHLTSVDLKEKAYLALVDHRGAFRKILSISRCFLSCKNISRTSRPASGPSCLL
jgi:hypothetical protein